MRPRSEIQSVILYNMTDSDGNWVPMKIEVNSWVTLMPGRNGGHAKDARKHGGYSMDGSYKAKVLEFRVKATSLASVHVQHAYMWRQLDLNPDISVPNTAACNYLYPSNFIEWIDPKSILGITDVLHAEIGELTRGSRSHRQLLDEGVFFYNALYLPRTRVSQFGQLDPILLPGFDSSEWSLPSMATSESFRAKLRADFQNVMKPATGSKRTHVSWFMPLDVFIDLFAAATSSYRTTTMWVFKNANEELCQSLMDGGWDTKITIGADIIKCTVQRESLIFRYHIARSTLYATFVFNRERMLPNSTWEAIDQFEPIQMVCIDCEFGDWKQVLEAGLAWSLLDIRQEIGIQLGSAAEVEFDMYIIDGDKTTKVNSRQEKKKIAADVLPPLKLLLVPKS